MLTHLGLAALLAIAFRLGLIAKNMQVQVIIGGLELLQQTSGKVIPTLSAKLSESVVGAMNCLEEEMAEAFASDSNPKHDVALVEQAATLAKRMLASSQPLTKLLGAIAEYKKKQEQSDIIVQCSQLCATACHQLEHLSAVQADGVDELKALLRHCKEQPAAAASEPMRQFAMQACNSVLGMEAGQHHDWSSLVDCLDLCVGWCPCVRLQGKVVDLRKLVGFFQKCSEGCGAVITLQKQLDEDRISDDQVSTSLSLLSDIASSQVKDELFDLPAKLQKDVVSYMQAIGDKCKDKQLREQEDLVTTAHAADWASGAGGGDLDNYFWHEGLAGDAKLADLLKHAAEGLENAKGSVINKESRMLEKHCERYLVLRQRYNQPLDSSEHWPEWFKSATDTVRTAKATVVAACMIGHMRAHHGNPIKLKNLMKAQIAEANRVLFKRSAIDLIPKTLYKGAEDAMKMKFSFPKA